MIILVPVIAEITLTPVGVTRTGKNIDSTSYLIQFLMIDKHIAVA